MSDKVEDSDVPSVSSVEVIVKSKSNSKVTTSKKSASGKRKGSIYGPRSNVWKFFEKLDQSTSKCLICEQKIRTSGNTTNLLFHLKRHPDAQNLVGEISSNHVLNFDGSGGFEVVEEFNGKTPNKRKALFRSSTSTRSLTMTPINSTSRGGARRQDLDYNYFSEEVTSELRRLKNFVKELQEPEDEFGHFGRYIATQIRSLPTEDAYETLREVHGIVLQKKLFAHKRDKQSGEHYSNLYTYTVRDVENDESETVVEMETVMPEDSPS